MDNVSIYFSRTSWIEYYKRTKEFSDVAQHEIGEDGLRMSDKEWTIIALKTADYYNYELLLKNSY